MRSSKRFSDPAGAVSCLAAQAEDHPGGPEAAPEADRPPVDRKVAARRAEAMRAFFPKLAIWLETRFHFARMREIERYLSQSTDLVDLERRIAQIERNNRWH
jgi:hypothetical protein